MFYKETGSGDSQGNGSKNQESLYHRLYRVDNGLNSEMGEQLLYVVMKELEGREIQRFHPGYKTGGHKLARICL